MAEAEAPGGLSLDELKSISLSAGEWLWGTVQGAFNEKATHSQMIVDAVIGMIPLVWDVTAARDLIAVSIGLCDDPKKREEKSQWIMLVVLLFALLPVIGGVIKGTGRLLLKATGEAAHLMGQGARFAHMAEAARDIIAFLNRVGVGKAEKWLVDLKFAAHEAEIVKALETFTKRLVDLLCRAKMRLGRAVPQAFADRIDALIRGLKLLKEEAARRIPDAIKDLDQMLREIQSFIHTGGETTSRAAAHAAAAGKKTLTYTEELILLEGNAAVRTARGGLAKNSGLADEIAANYTHVPGYPKLTDFRTTLDNGDELFPLITTYAGKIVNRDLEAGEEIFRVFGPAGTTHGFPVKDTFAAGAPTRTGQPTFWGLNKVPQSAEAWRQRSAVLDEWNRDGFIVVGKVLPGGSPVKACTGMIAEQTAEKIGAQYLKGGGKQAMLALPADVSTEINQLAKTAMSSKSLVTKEIGGIQWEIRPTGWDDVNGVHGYLNAPGPGSVQTARLGAREIASKQANED